MSQQKKFKKIAITGHTSGIGQGLFNYFESQGHEVCGYSRSNGYALPDAQDKILELVQDVDIFVNNALPISSQIYFINQLWPKWQQLDKTILVIGTIAAHFQTSVDAEFAEYQHQKQMLNTLCNRLRYDNFPNQHQCRLIAIHPGFTYTNIFPPDYPMPDQHLVMSVQDVVNTVDLVLDSPLKIEDISFRK